MNLRLPKHSKLVASLVNDLVHRFLQSVSQDFGQQLIVCLQLEGNLLVTESELLSCSSGTKTPY